jgi:hypothetical protein
MRWTLAILITAALIAGCAPICENEVSAAARSPSGKMKAVIFNRGCGATVGYNTQVSILSAEAALPNDGGNVLIVDDDVPLALHWESEGSLQIAGRLSSHIFKQETSWREFASPIAKRSIPRRLNCAFGTSVAPYVLISRMPTLHLMTYRVGKNV